MRSARIIAAAALTLLTLASCGSDAESTSSSQESFDSVSNAIESDSTPAGDSAEAATVAVTGQTATAGRLIARTASVNVLVEDLGAAITEANSIGTKAEGFVSAEQTSQFSSELTFKVPGDKFDSVLVAFGELGQLDSQWITSEDRTSQIVDLQARLDTAEASLARTRELFNAATSVGELVTAENEIAQREEVVEILKAQLRSQESSVSMATITVYLTIDPDSLPAEPVVDEEDLPTIQRAFENGLNLLWYVMRLVGITIAWLAPWIPVIAIGAFVTRVVRRRLAARPQKPARQKPQTLHQPWSGSTQAAAPAMPSPPPPATPAPPVGGDDVTSHTTETDG